MKKILFSIVVVLIIIGGITISDGLAQPQIKVSLALPGSGGSQNQHIYLINDPIRMVITLNNYGLPVITSKGFRDKPFHLFLIFTDPDRRIITTNDRSIGGAEDPPPPKMIPLNDKYTQVEAVETVEAGWTLSITIPNAHAFYTLSKVGCYSVKAVIPIRTYPSVVSSGFSEIDSSNYSGALESNPVRFCLVQPAGATGTIKVTAEKHTVGTGNHPGSTKTAIAGLPLRAFDRSSPCVSEIGASQYGFSWQNYLPIWSCPSVTVSCTPLSPPADKCTTDANGIANLIVAPGDYVVIGLYDPTANQPGDEVLVGSKLDGLQAGQTVQKYLQVIVKADDKKVPAKTTKITGSELLVIEPEYIEWDGTQELYPFIFESIGDWTVTTSVSPPEGFVADNKSLTAEVDTQISAVQFVITDMGSKWEDTKVEHKIKHKGQTESIKSDVGIKLSKELAKQKGKSVLGDEERPKK